VEENLTGRSPHMLRRMLRKTSKSPLGTRDRATILCEIARFDRKCYRHAARSPTFSRFTMRCQEARRPAHPHASRPAPHAAKLAASKRTLRGSHSLRPRRPFAGDQRGQLVYGFVQRTQVRRMLIALGSAHLHHRRGTQRPPQRLQPSRRAAARRAQINRDD
jgi:hypothetical protein